jgi:hypothetical protein
VAIEVGQPAAYDGILMSHERAVRLGQKAESCEFLIELQNETQKKLSEIDLRFVRKTHEVDVEVWTAKEKFYKDTIDAQRVRAFWFDPLFVVPVTVVLTYGILRAAKDLP